MAVLMRTSLAEGEIENESPCDRCDHRIIGGARIYHRIIGGARICCGGPQQGGGVPGRGAEKEGRRRDREGVQRHAQEDQPRTAREEGGPVGEYALMRKGRPRSAVSSFGSLTRRSARRNTNPLSR